MTHRELKRGYFVLEGLNSLSTAYYFHYLFFCMERRFGFGDLENLGLCALNGFVYMFAAMNAGRFAQRRGYFFAVKLGLLVMCVALALGSVFVSVPGQTCTLLLWTVGISFTWPVLEALVSEGESPTGLQRMIGIYNLVWAGCSALAYFVGGALLDRFGIQSIYTIPAAIHILQLLLVMWLERKAAVLPPPCPAAAAGTEFDLHVSARPIGKSKAFLTMAWIANPFAFVAINTVVAVIPTLARKFGLSPTWAGVFCSAWFFARLAAFLMLWIWPGWHYRFGWFVSAYVLLIGSFAALLLAPALWMVVAAQVAFGYATGLLYYASLYYSMDVGDTKGEHGGIHEAAIGAGVFAGPAAGAAALFFFPKIASAPTYAVSGLLACGLAAILVVRRRSWVK
jgi:predicted MFS family arabinose efflux permease